MKKLDERGTNPKLSYTTRTPTAKSTKLITTRTTPTKPTTFAKSPIKLTTTPTKATTAAKSPTKPTTTAAKSPTKPTTTAAKSPTKPTPATKSQTKPAITPTKPTTATAGQRNVTKQKNLFYIGGNNGVVHVEKALIACGMKRTNNPDHFFLKWVECQNNINYCLFTPGMLYRYSIL